MSSDAQIARQWAENFIKHAGNAQIVDAAELTAARYILATTTAPTMADIAWGDAVHAGLCAEHPVYGVVRMMYADGGMIDCILPGMSLLMISAKDLTPLPGTRVDLAPRREPKSTPEPEQPRPEDVKPDPQPGEAWLIEYEGRRYEAVYWYSPIYAHWAFVENREGLKTIESPEATPVSRLLEGGNHEPR